MPKGTRVIIVYDKAAIDFTFWKRCRQECAVYFISRVKENMVFDWIESVPVNQADPRNHGVTEDRRVRTRDGHLLRIVYYTDPQTAEKYEFLTNEPDLPPGVIVELYRRRWEAEKVFDQIKNKLNEKKAWATSLVAKEAQAQLIAITHNLLLIYEQKLENEHGVVNVAEDQRRAKRVKQRSRRVRRQGTRYRHWLYKPGVPRSAASNSSAGSGSPSAIRLRKRPLCCVLRAYMRLCSCHPWTPIPSGI